MLQKPRCPLCESDKNYQVLYKSNFRKEDLSPATFSARRMPDKLHFQIVRCKKDGLVRSSPIADVKTLVNLYKKSQFNYEEETSNLTKTYIKALNPILKKLPKNANILEIGCGNGFLLKALSDLGYKNVFGVEPSQNAVEKSHQNIKQHIKVTTLKPGLFKENSFNLVFFFQTLDHIINPNQFLNICFKLLKKNGFILAFNHNIDSLSARILKEKSPIIDIEHTFLYSPQTIKLLFENNKFTPLKKYSPANYVSLKHLFRLTGIKWVFGSVLNISLLLNLGNLCIIAQKR